jgi:HEAT repeat protein
MEEIKPLIEELTSGDESRAESAVKKLQEIGPQALPYLEMVLESSDIDAVWWAIWAVSGIEDERAAALIVAKLSDPNPLIRQAAALAFRSQPGPNAIEPLVILLEDDDPITVHLAAAALAAIGEEAVPTLLDLLKNSPLAVRLEIMRALAAIGDVRSIPALFEILESDSALMEHWANQGLDNMGVGMNFFKT